MTTLAQVNEDSSFSVLARVHADGSNIVQTDLSSISRSIYNGSSGALISGPTALTVANVIFDTLQVDGRWSKDSTGYNFRDDIGSTVLTDPSIEYVLEYKFTLNTGTVFYMNEIRITVVGLFSS